MKKKNTYGITTQISLYIILFFIPNMVLAQTECPDPSAGDFLEVNNVRAWINNDQLQFYTGSDAIYEVPAGSGVSSFFATNMWIGGITADGQLRIAADQYAIDESRFAPGPLNDNAQLDDDLCEIYDRLYIVSREMSETHYAYFQSVAAGTVAVDFPDGYQLPQVLLDYPGSIYTSTGLNEHGAPYFDYNDDGLYDATQGDFPLFNGMIDGTDCASCESLNGDVCFYWINNDMKSFEDQEPIGIEIHNMVYAFASSDAVNNTVFFKKRMINRSSQTLYNSRIGIWADPDLGCAEDDYAACDVQRNLGIIVNGSEIDSDCSLPGYGENPPSAGILALTTPTEYNDVGDLVEVDFSGFATFSNLFGYPQTDPNNSIEYFNYMSSKWQNGEPITYGGTGIGGSQVASYMYPHDTDPEGIGTDDIAQDPWSEFGEANIASDRRFVMSFGPFTMEPGEVNCLTYATIFAENDGDENHLNAIQLVADEVIELYDGCFEELAVGIDEFEVEDVAVIQWNISSNALTVKSKNNETLTILVMDDIGRLVKSIETNDEQTISLSDVASGMYVINIINRKGTKQSEKIVKL